LNYTVTAEDGSTEQECTVVTNSRPFITWWTINGAEALEIELNNNLSYDFSFVWKDDNGNTAQSGRHTSANGDFTTTLSVGGIYRLEINVDFPHLEDYPRNHLLDVLQWGHLVGGSFSKIFRKWTGADAISSLTNDNGRTIAVEGASCSSDNDILTFNIPGNQASDEVIEF
jgi:hypothetical protein